ncbi:hypothetical protein L2E82_46852 [Cichorium intybus]|uniref:Uncharacterized protein n=1 Tax=Cichorium intybus TaxID=13427 RepID=A0ACB8YU42_CICIN|nr:hypothetical protein L2E82_46852 [Cichorium intybus]
MATAEVAMKPVDSGERDESCISRPTTAKPGEGVKTSTRSHSSLPRFLFLLASGFTYCTQGNTHEIKIPDGYKRPEIKIPSVVLQLNPEDVLDDGKRVLDVVDQAVSGLVRVVLLNCGDGSGRSLYDAACLLKSVIRDPVYFLIAERVDIATAINASGVFLYTIHRTTYLVMDLLLLFITLVTTISCFLVFGRPTWIKSGASKSSKGRGKTVPEASGSWPIIGHMHLLAGSQVPYKLLGSMADKLGPMFTIKLGVHRVLVVNNAEIAKECLTTNDKVFASRPKAMATELMGYNYANFSVAPYGSYWRDIRKMIVQELGSQHGLQMLSHIRTSELKSSIRDLHKDWMANKGSSETIKVDMSQWFGNLILNVSVRVIFGNWNSFPSGKQKEDELKKNLRRSVELFGAFVPSDAIPALKWLDIGGYAKEMKQTAKVLDASIEELLKESRKKMNSTEQVEEEKGKVFMDALLSRIKDLKEDLYGFSVDSILKATCLATFSAATDTTTVTLIWALALLVNNPVVLKKAQQELETHVGRDRTVEESDMNKLVYLQAIIKETMRLYPAVPLSFPHESTEDCIVGGCTIPKGTRLFVNIWKIQHDPKIWEDPFEFIPERFLTSKKDIDVKGQHFELIPFGSGRRICLGISFALNAVQLILATIIHGFEFQNPSSEPTDMTESFGLTNQKATPLELVVAPRFLPDF